MKLGRTAVPQYRFIDYSYTVIWNAMEIPAAVTPVTAVSLSIYLLRKLDVSGFSNPGI